MASTTINSKPHSGGCLCGQVRYEAEGEPLRVAICHCRSCQKASGSAFSVNAVFPEAAVRLTGELAVFQDIGSSGHPTFRHFCRSCGTPIRSEAMQTRGFFVVKAGTLDEPERVQPTVEVFGEREIRSWRRDVN
jgi:hypothetical protein